MKTIEKRFIVNSMMQAIERTVAKGWKPASEKQINFLAQLVERGKISPEQIADQDNYLLPSSKASKLISQGLA